MSLSEKRVLRQVSILPNEDAINVQWANQILRGEDVVSESYERKAYTREQMDQFIKEVDNAAAYCAALGWSVAAKPSREF